MLHSIISLSDCVPVCALHHPCCFITKLINVVSPSMQPHFHFSCFLVSFSGFIVFLLFDCFGTVLYYTTFSFSLLTCVLASFLNLCLSIASLLVSHVSCSPSPLPFCLYFSLLPNHSLPQYVCIVTYSFKVLRWSLIVVQPHLLYILDLESSLSNVSSLLVSSQNARCKFISSFSFGSKV